MDKTSSRISIAIVAAADPHAHSPYEPAAEKATHSALRGVWCAACLRLALLASVTYSFAVTAWRVRREPEDLAFVAGAGAVLAALFLCLRRAERLTADSLAGERWRLQVAVCALSTVLSCAFAYRISLVMPAGLVIVIWCMTSLVVIMGFCMLVLCNGRQYEAVEDVDCDAAPVDGKSFKKTSHADELV